MSALNGKAILILATNGFEQSELELPQTRLKEAGADVHVASLEPGEIKGWDNKNWGRAVNVDKTLDEVDVASYDALVLPGGQMNPDTLRGDKNALALIKAFFDQGKVVAAVCHAPWLLIDTGIAKARKVTSYKTIKQDLINAGLEMRDFLAFGELGDLLLVDLLDDVHGSLHGRCRVCSRGRYGALFSVESRRIAAISGQAGSIPIARDGVSCGFSVETHMRQSSSPAPFPRMRPISDARSVWEGSGG